MNWKVGDIAICIKVGPIDASNQSNDVYPSLRLNYEYIIHKIHICECGELLFDVGLSNTTPNGVMCICGAISSNKSGIWWCNSKRFVKSDLNAELEEAILQQDYIAAAKIRDKIKEIPDDK